VTPTPVGLAVDPAGLRWPVVDVLPQYTPMKTYEYQKKGLTKKGFHKLLILQDVVLPCLRWDRIVPEKKSGSQGCRSSGETHYFLMIFIAKE
jgi:hypothetical protein